MQYIENSLTYEDYQRLRTSAGWKNFAKLQAERALAGSRYTVTAVWHGRTVAMGRVIGDGMYHILADVIVQPDFQRRRIGTTILTMLLAYIDEQTPAGGRTSIQLIAEPGKEAFYERFGFKKIPHEFCGSGMRKVIYKE
ncbi:MAG: GNAT family N-acetyltransferase [Lachnospiraceae bacterium]|nr:GNAT family N-acetyltransferase [Lachnospiraceae bacterium]